MTFTRQSLHISTHLPHIGLKLARGPSHTHTHVSPYECSVTKKMDLVRASDSSLIKISGPFLFHAASRMTPSAASQQGVSSFFSTTAPLLGGFYLLTDSCRCLRSFVCIDN